MSQVMGRLESGTGRSTICLISWWSSLGCFMHKQHQIAISCRWRHVYWKIACCLLHEPKIFSCHAKRVIFYSGWVPPIFYLTFNLQLMKRHPTHDYGIRRGCCTEAVSMSPKERVSTSSAGPCCFEILKVHQDQWSILWAWPWARVQ